MKIPPLVSVNIRTYNSAKTLHDTLVSVKKQMYRNIEILISDGYSKDDSVDIAKKYGAKVHFADKLGDARYQNYQKSRGTYILSLDSDQTLDPKLIESCVELCESQNLDALTISERSKIQKGTLVEKLIAYDKWVIDENKDADVVFGTACPRFFRKSVLATIVWPKELAVFDDTILYDELLKKGANIGYLSSPSIYHYEVTSWKVFFKKFFRYGKGYFGALKERPGTIAFHSLPRRSYFSPASLSKPHYFLGLLFLYFVKVTAAGFGVLTYLFGELKHTLVGLGDWGYYATLGKYLQNAKSVLDVGCGSNSPIAKVKKHFYSVGVDMFAPSIEKSRKAGIHDAYKRGNVLAIDRMFGSKKFDAVIALDLIEHLEKKQGYDLIKKMSTLAKKKIIIMTPNGFYKQDPYEGNTYQIHKSGWTVDDFIKLGFTVRGIRGIKWLRGEYATLKWRPWIFWGIVSVLSEPFIYFFPRSAHQLFAVKEMQL